MTARCNLIDADYRAFRRHVLFRVRKIHWLYGILLVLLLAVTWFGGKPNESATEKVYVLTGEAMVFGLICGVSCLAIWTIRRFGGMRFRGTLGEHVFEVSDAGLTEANAVGRTETRLIGIKRIDETARHFFVFTTSGVAHIMPKRHPEVLDVVRALNLGIKNNQANHTAVPASPRLGGSS
jgi:hypothetical protein